MKIWIDISNAPHVRFFRKLMAMEDVLVTARNFGPIPQMLDSLGVDYKLIGEHGGSEPKKKLIASSNRVSELAEVVSEFKPDIAVHKYSVEGARVAVGLNLPYIAVADNEIAYFQNLLTLPFAKTIVLPKAIDKIDGAGSKEETIIRFDGVCEVAHVQDFTPDRTVLEKIDTGSDPLVVVRDSALHAAYNHGETFLGNLLPILEDQAKVVVVPREGQKAPAGVTLTDELDTLSLCYYADAVISGGGTMTREAALLGTRAISMFPKKLAVDDYLISKGLLEHITADNLSNLEIKKEKKRKVPEMENPIDKVLEVLNGEASNG